MDENQLKKLLDLLESGDITDAELSDLLKYYNSFQMNQHWNTDSMGDFEEVKSRVYRNISARDKMPAVTLVQSWMLWAAASILVLTLCWFGYQDVYMRRIITVQSSNEAKDVLLPDGSKVVLNVNSSLSYPAKFEKDRREVAFTGEGYFDVATDSVHPFVIETEALKVKVVGTEFNLKAYGEDPRVETSLLEGKVVLLSKDEKQTLSILKPNQKFIADKVHLQRQTVDSTMVEKLVVEEIKFIDDQKTTPVDVAWTEGKLAFSSTRLDDIARLLSRKYNLRIRVSNPETGAFRYSGSFDRESVSEILKALQYVKHFNYRREGDEIILY